MRDPILDNDISGSDLIRFAKDNGVKNAYFIPTKAEIHQFILNNAQAGDRIVIMGARDNSLPQYSRDLLKDL